jgi:hypothetical protein
MKQLVCSVLLIGLMASVSFAASYRVADDFNSSWTGDYAPGWKNTAYRHGEAPVGKMMQQVNVGGEDALKLIAASTPQSWMWWAAVSPEFVDSAKMTKEYDPYLKVKYYDTGLEEGDLHAVGQLAAVPSWTNLYLENGTEDWTDTQLGARVGESEYYHVAAGQGHPGWQSTGVDRPSNEPSWREFKMQLLNSDGRIHYYIDGVEVGTSFRNDYADLTGAYLMIQFTDPLSGWGENSRPYVILDDFEAGSNYVPEPLTIAAVFGGVSALGGYVRRRRRA